MHIVRKKKTAYDAVLLLWSTFTTHILLSLCPSLLSEMRTNRIEYNFQWTFRISSSPYISIVIHVIEWPQASQPIEMCNKLCARFLWQTKHKIGIILLKVSLTCNSTLLKSIVHFFFRFWSGIPSWEQVKWTMVWKEKRNTTISLLNYRI